MRKIVLIGIPTGAILGVVAGLVGIGGGICLSLAHSCGDG